MADEDAPVMMFIFNKKEFYEKTVRESGKDLRKSEVESFVKSIQDNSDAIYERRKLMRGCGILYTEHGKFKNLLEEVFYVYELGFYHSTILLCGTTAERICYDFVDFSEITINNKTVQQETKESLYELPFRHLLEFLVKLGAISRENSDKLHEIYNRRNTYVHAKKEGDVQKDALWCINALSEVLESIFSAFRFYDLRDGKFYRKPKYRD